VETERWRRIEELYHSALELDGSQREAFLEQACGGDESLWREVESLLAEAQGTEDFLARSSTSNRQVISQRGVINLSPSRRDAKNARTRRGYDGNTKTVDRRPRLSLITPTGEIRTAGEIPISATRPKWPGASYWSSVRAL
jgi:hypothetical protein